MLRWNIIPRNLTILSSRSKVFPPDATKKMSKAWFTSRDTFIPNSNLLKKANEVPAKNNLPSSANWSSLGLMPQLCSNLEAMKISTPNSIQQKALPVCLGGDDVILTAETGSGKTLVYAAWMVHKILNLPADSVSSKCHPLGLIFVPSKELIWQVALEIKRLACGTDIEVIFDRPSIKKANPECKRYILISTPMSLAQTTQAELNDLMDLLERTKLVVLDEMDLLLSFSFANKTQLILARLSSTGNRQFMFCGASLDPSTSRKALRTYLSNKFPEAERIDSKIAHCTVPTLEECFVTVPKDLQAEQTKSWILENMFQLLKDYSCLETDKSSPDLPRVALVFLSDINSAEEYNLLAKEHFAQNPDIMCLQFHKKIPSKNREEVLKSLKLGWADETTPPKLIVLFTTDLLSRGIDIQNLDLVLHAHFPKNITLYLHRVGRTARAGRTGKSIGFIAPEDYRLANEVKAVAARKKITPKSNALTDHSEESLSLGGLFSRRRSLNRKLKEREARVLQEAGSK